MKHFLIPLFCIISAAVSAQHPYKTDFINSTRQEAFQQLEQYLAFHKYPGTFYETDSTITLHTQVSHLYSYDAVYYFDSTGKCNSYMYSSCDTCVKTYFKNLLARKEYKWKKLADNKYISKYDKGLLLEALPVKGNFSMRVRRLDLSKEDYQQLLKSIE